MGVEEGTDVGPYRIVGRIGRGGMATVYRARQPALGRDVALKVLPSFHAEDPRFRERFRREAMAIAKIRHPNVVTVHDAGEAEGILYIATELVEGGTLSDRLTGPMPVDEVVALLRPIAAALDHAHAEGVLHRDVKPSNILIDREGRPLLSDFGLARILSEEAPLRTATGIGVGTPEYMAPEHAGGAPVGAAADEYSLAIVAYQMLTGRLPYTGGTPVEVLGSQLRGALPLPRSVNPAISYAVQEVLVRALARDPRRRYPTASAFIDALGHATTERASVRTRIRRAYGRAAAGRRRPIVAALGAVLAVVVIASAVVLGQVPTSETVLTALGPSIPEKAALFTAVQLDAAGSYISRREIGPDATAASVRTEPGVLELSASQPGARAVVDLRARHPVEYVADLDVELDLASPQDIFVWQLYRAGAKYHTVVVTGEDVHIAFMDEETQAVGRILSKAPVGQSFRRSRSTISVAFSGSRYILYLDGRRVLAVDDTRGPEGSFQFSVSGNGSTSARITGLRVYRHVLPGPT